MLGVEGTHRSEKSKVTHQVQLSPLGIGAENEERPQQKVCCRPGDETGGLDLEEQREKGR